MFTRLRTFALAAAISAVFAAPALAKGPPWISIELPVNPYDRTMQGAFLLVHAFHHQTPIGFPIEGTAEGMVNGERRTVKLEFAETSRDGVYALKRTWATDGVWTLVIRVTQGPADAEGGTATAVVEAFLTALERVPWEDRRRAEASAWEDGGADEQRDAGALRFVDGRHGAFDDRLGRERRRIALVRLADRPTPTETAEVFVPQRDRRF